MSGPRGAGGDGRPTLVVLRALGVGDLLTSLPALRALADAFPGHHRVLAAPAALAPLAVRSGAVDEVADTRPFRPLTAGLGHCAVAVNLHGRGPQSHRVLLAARPQRLIAFRHRDVHPDPRAPRWRPREHEVARWCRLLEEHGVPADPTRLDLDVDTREAPPAARGATLVHPGAASAARRWPADRWVRVVRAERAAGRRVVVTGGPDEVALAQGIARRADLPPAAVLAGATTLPVLAATVATARRVVCGDTGVAHLATAVATPSVVLFGPVPPSEWGPPAQRPHHRALWAGRRGDPHADTPDPGLLQIRVADVLAALDEIDGGYRMSRLRRASASSQPPWLLQHGLGL